MALNNNEFVKEPLVNHQRSKLRPFLVDGVLRRYDSDDVQAMRHLGYTVEPILDPEKKIKSIVPLAKSNKLCEICQDLPGIKSSDIFPATIKIKYEDESTQLVCGFHKPADDNDPDDWTDH
jgi:hypothetical protein